MRILLWGSALFLFALVGLMGVRLVSFIHTERALAEQMASQETALRDIQKDKAKLEHDLQFLDDPANVEKEIRARFPYRAPDETLMVIVPKAP
jgi:cell division protein FtsB